MSDPAGIIGIDARLGNGDRTDNYIRNLVAALCNLDTEHRFVLFVEPKQTDFDTDLPPNFGVVAEPAPHFSLRERIEFSWKINRNKIDLLHVTRYCLPRFLSCRSVVTVHDVVDLFSPQHLKGRISQFYAQRSTRRLLAQADRILVHSQNSKTDLMDYYRVSGKKLRVIYPGIDDRYVDEADAGEIERVKNTYGLERPYLLSTASPKGRKNLDTIVRAYAQALAQESLNVDLVCLHERRGAEFKVRQRSDQLGIRNRIHLLDDIDPNDLPILYRGAMAFFYLTLYEESDLTAIEAMASGLPLVASNTASLRELVEGYAELIDPLDVDTIAAMIIRLAQNEEHRHSLARLAARRAEEFRWESAAQATLEVYARLLRSPRRNPFRPTAGRISK